jgi:hypothetical protein
MQYNLLVINAPQDFNFVNNGLYWSSAASQLAAPGIAWGQQIAVGGGDGLQGNIGVSSMFGVRCVRDLQ